MAISALAWNCVFAVPRVLVSQNKRRFRQNGFDLDLCYLHPRVIVMGYPSVGVELMYRNPRSEVVRFLEERHADNYFVYNFCSEPARCYPASIFHGRVKALSIEDHNVPTFEQMISFCEDAVAWLDADENHIVALHCKAGKGRAGMMACMLLLRMGYAKSSHEAVNRYNQMRVYDNRGLTVVSQRKWVHYYECLLAKTPPPARPIQEPTFVIKELTIQNALTGVTPPKLRLRIYQLDAILTTKILLDQIIGYEHFVLAQEIRGSVLLEFCSFQCRDCRIAKHFKVWFNTLFISPDTNTGKVVFNRNAMDWVHRDKKRRKFPAAFELEMTVATE